MKKNHKGKILNIETIAQDTVKMQFTTELQSILPGQFVSILIPNKTLRRPFSVADFAQGVITVIFKVKGDGTNYLKSLKTGDIIDYVIVDTLPEGLSCNKSDITIFQKSANNEFNSIEFSLTFIDTTATITIPSQNITTSSDVIINFPTKIINKELLPREFTNICSIDLIYPHFEPQSKINLSNAVNVNLPEEDTSQKLTPYLIVLFLYYCCCCYCNKE